MLTFEIYKVNKTKIIKYVEVILQIKYNDSLEYLSYEVVDKFDFVDKRSKTSKDKSQATLIAFIVIGAILFIIVVILIILILRFNHKNKDLLEKVNKISFAENDQRIMMIFF